MKTELRQKVLLQVSFRELHIDMLKKFATGFSMAYDDNENVRISDSSLQFILPPKLRNMTQRHQIMRGCEICIQAGTYQE